MQSFPARHELLRHHTYSNTRKLSPHRRCLAWNLRPENRCRDSVEARGFIFAPALAYHLGTGFVPVRKPKKLPAECASISYDLEYGQDTLQIHRDAIGDGHRVIIADDLLATGGTAKAVVDLVEGLGGKVVGLVFVVELEFLSGRQKLAGLMCDR